MGLKGFWIKKPGGEGKIYRRDHAATRVSIIEGKEELFLDCEKLQSVQESRVVVAMTESYLRELKRGHADAKLGGAHNIDRRFDTELNLRRRWERQTRDEASISYMTFNRYRRGECEH